MAYQHCLGDVFAWNISRIFYESRGGIDYVVKKGIFLSTLSGITHALQELLSMEQMTTHVIRAAYP